MMPIRTRRRRRRTSPSTSARCEAPNCEYTGAPPGISHGNCGPAGRISMTPMANPYPGPRPFQKDEYRIFAGRDHEVSELTSLIISHQVTLLYAQSGAGKTSVVNAGLSTSLVEKGVRVLPVARAGIPVPKE